METGSLWGSHVGVAALSHSGSGKSEMKEAANCSPQKSDSVDVQKFWLDDVKCLVHTTQKVTIPPFSTINVQANTSVRGHYMWVHVPMEPVLGPQLPAAVVPTATYRELFPGSSRVPVCLHNRSTHAVEIPTKTVVGQVVPGNQILPVVHLTRTAKETNTQESKGWVLEALDLQGLTEWPESEQKQARELLLKWDTCLCTVTWTWVKLLWSSIKFIWKTKCSLRSITDEYPDTCMMMWGPIFRRCWIFVLSVSCPVCAPVQ